MRVRAVLLIVVPVAWLAGSCTALLGDFESVPGSGGFSGSASGSGGDTTSGSGAGGAAATTTSSGGSGGGGGQGGAMSCISPADCDDPSNPCEIATCVGGACSTEFVAEGLDSPRQVPGDCGTIVCDADGAFHLDPDKTDEDDENPCTSNKCSGPPGSPVPEHDPLTGDPCSFDGGQYCNDLAECVECGLPANCPGDGECNASYHCMPPTCTDGLANQDETDADCGGIICFDRCKLGASCSLATDCESGVCQGTTCRLVTCGDGAKNNTETDIDCGGSDCLPRCATGKLCSVAGDCTSNSCNTAVTPPVCL